MACGMILIVAVKGCIIGIVLFFSKTQYILYIYNKERKAKVEARAKAKTIANTV